MNVRGAISPAGLRRTGAGAERSKLPSSAPPPRHKRLTGAYFAKVIAIEAFCCVRESAGINRHGEGDENALHRRSSDPRWPRVMRWRSVRAQRSVDRGRVGGAIEPRNDNLVQGADALLTSGRPCCRRRYRDSLADPARSKNPGTHVSSMRENREIPWSPVLVVDAPSGMVRGVAGRLVAGRGGNAEAVIP